MKVAKADVAYQWIKDKISTGEYKAYQDLSEDDLQNDLNISRTPIREALQKLEKDKFVTIYPRKGTIVTNITLELINEVYEIRESIEPFVARKVCHKLDVNWLLNMKEKFSTEPDVNNSEERKMYYTNLDMELHKGIITTHDNAFINNIMGNIFDHDHRIRIKTTTVNEKYNTSIEEHLQIIDAFLRNDANEAEDKVREHIVSSRSIVIHSLFGRVLTS